MKKLIAALILAAAGSRAFAAESGLSGVSENLAPQLEIAAAPAAGPEDLGRSGENISIVLQGGQGLSQVSAVEAAPFAAPQAAVAVALAPARAQAPSSALAVENPRWAASGGRPKSSAFEIVAVLLLLAASAMSYYAICHAFSEVAGKAFSQDASTSIEETFPR